VESWGPSGCSRYYFNHFSPFETV
jgi:hypothetical protein